MLRIPVCVCLCVCAHTRVSFSTLVERDHLPTLKFKHQRKKNIQQHHLFTHLQLSRRPSLCPNPFLLVILIFCCSSWLLTTSRRWCSVSPWRQPSSYLTKQSKIYFLKKNNNKVFFSWFVFGQVPRIFSPLFILCSFFIFLNPPMHLCNSLSHNRHVNINSQNQRFL